MTAGENGDRVSDDRRLPSLTWIEEGLAGNDNIRGEK